MEKANVTWIGRTNQPEVDIKDPKAEAKRNDDYMNNEEPDDEMPQSLEEALLGEWLEQGHLRVGPLFLWWEPDTLDTSCRLDGGDRPAKISAKKFQLRKLI